MTPRPILLALAVSLAPACGGGGDGGTTPTPQSTAFAGTPYPATPLLPNGLRNKYKWPFTSDSIWNVPIGSGARYVSAGIAGAHGASGMSSIGATVRVGDRNYHFDSREATPGASASGRRTWPRSSPRSTSWTTTPPAASGSGVAERATCHEAAAFLTREAATPVTWRWNDVL
jgi:hypothetical protein